MLCFGYKKLFSMKTYPTAISNTEFIVQSINVPGIKKIKENYNQRFSLLFRKFYFLECHIR